MSSSKTSIDRRSFLSASATAAAGLSIVPRHVLGGPGYRAPSDQLRLGYVGTGTQGIRTLTSFLEREDMRVKAVCDCNRDSQDYIEWGKNDIRNRIRRFLDRPDWGEGNTGCRCGLEVGREVIDGYYSRKDASGQFKAVAAYEDYREMLDKEDLDGVCVMTPEHTHATIAIAAMEKGKHVIMHKPISNVLSEVRLAAEVAAKKGVGTHLFCSADQAMTPMIREWLDADAIGPVREVHVWSHRPVWPQDLLVPKETPPVPDGFSWDLWLGPEEMRPYHPLYTHTAFRSWYDFGTGPLGDMGHYCLFQVWKILDLESAISVEATGSTFFDIVDGVSKRMVNKVSFPRAARVTWEFPARGDKPPVTIHWYDGGIRPPKFQELTDDGRKMPSEGVLYVGDTGKLLTGFTGGSPRLIPEKAMKAFNRPPKTLERPEEELDQWARACRGEKPSDARFEVLCPINETLLLGTIGLRVSDKLNWDAAEMKFTNSDVANALVYRKYRKGWELPVKRG